MRNTKKQSRNKRAFIAMFDCLFALIIIIMVLTPVLIHVSNLSTSSNLNAKNSQKLSSLLQISEYYYSIAAAKTSSAPYSLDTYSHSGILSQGFNPNDSPPDYRSMGLIDFSIHLTPPKIITNEQFCIKRKMLGDNSQPADIWFCAS